MRDRADQLKEEVTLLIEACKDVEEKLKLVDVLQHLGIDHHFERDIVVALSDIHSADFNSSSLHDVALRFRLLRQHGLWVSPDEFNKFKGPDGRFNDEVIDDPMGMLSLYNAAHLLIHGEVELEEAILFSRHQLETVRASNLKSPPLLQQVTRALQMPLPRTSNRIEALNYIAEYNQEQACNPSVLELARLDFNLLQLLHLRELKEFSRWDESAISVLPEYLKNYYAKLLSTFTEIEDELKSDEKYYITYAVKAYQWLCKHYLQQAVWFHQNYIPSFQDHLDVSIVSSGISMMSVVSFVSAGDLATKEALEWAFGCTDAVKACSEIGRFLNDFAAFKVTKEALEWAFGCTDAVKACSEIGRFLNDFAAFKHGKAKLDMVTSVESYMKEHNVTGEVATAVLSNMVEDAWKTINQARFERSSLLPAVNRVANLAMSIVFIYRGSKDAYTFSKLNKKTIEQLFVKPIPI
uniref:Terpene synthase N-terminal domain-containing protein n=1 Tax=Oryza meridionalis TaxID=40149 RepID=A0A0E0D0G3_9ORYZ